MTAGSAAPASLRDRARELLAPEGPALDLAIVRITVASVLTLSTSVAAAPDWAALPVAARTIPRGVGWLVPLLPIDPDTTNAARVVFHVALALGALGLFTRASWIVVCVTTFLLLLVPQLGGAVFHDHHLLWLAVILAASPCGDALSIDAWRARRRGQPLPVRSRTHGLAVRLCWLVIGLVFFFPGVHKLAASGLAWALSDNLRNQMWWKWTQDPSLVPPFRIDRHPWVIRALALLTIVFELSFVPLVLAPRTRALAVLGACAFHLGAELFMGIQFSVLWGTYTMFVPWQAIVDRARPSEAQRPTAQAAPEASRALVSVAAPLFAGILIFGAMGEMQAYPFACYPTFAWRAPDHMPALELTVVRADGTDDVLDRDVFQEAGPRGWALSWRLAGVYGAFDRDAFLAWFVDRSRGGMLSHALEDAQAVRVARVEIDVDPDGSRAVVERRALLTLRREGAGWVVGE